MTRITRIISTAAAGMALVILTGGAGDPVKPEILTMADQKMAVVYTLGDPATVAGQAVSALYGTVYALQGSLKSEGVDLEVGALRARWPDSWNKPKEEWTGVWGLAIPATVDSIPSVTAGVEVKIETWRYGTVAQILHEGPYEAEPATIQRLMEFIAKSGYEIAGSHEEEYLTPPGAPDQKTIIRYPVKKK